MAMWSAYSVFVIDVKIEAAKVVKPTYCVSILLIILMLWSPLEVFQYFRIAMVPTLSLYYTASADITFSILSTGASINT